MRLGDILSSAGKSKRRKRIGRGTGSGRGKTSGRGHKGMGARSGGARRLGFEGGQTPALARIPKRGFNNFLFRKEYQIVNLTGLERFDDGATVDGTALKAARLIEDAAKPVKILAGGDLTKKLTVVATKFSAKAAEKIAQVGGSVQQA